MLCTGRAGGGAPARAGAGRAEARRDGDHRLQPELEGDLATLRAGARGVRARGAADPKLQAQARASAEQSLRALFVGLGFTEVEFVQQLPPMASRG